MKTCRYEREAIPYKALDGVIDALSRALRQLPRDRVAPLLPEHAAALLRTAAASGEALEPYHDLERAAPQTVAAAESAFSALAFDRASTL
jgi:hypothetical protein